MFAQGQPGFDPPTMECRPGYPIQPDSYKHNLKQHRIGAVVHCWLLA